MTTTRTGHPRPTFDAEALRVDLARVAPDRLSEFDLGRADAVAEARTRTSPEPLRIFAEAWAIELEIAQRPDWVKRLRELDRDIEQGGSLEDARGIAGEISEIRMSAAKAVGLVRGSE